MPALLSTNVLRVFGFWNAALEAEGLPTNRYAWDGVEVLDRLAGWARSHGRPPTIAYARADGELPHSATCRELFGSWNAALRAAALTPAHEAHWSDDDVYAVLARWARWHIEHGRGEPSASIYREWAARQPKSVPSASSIKRRFGGSWNAVRFAVSLPASRSGRPFARARTPRAAEHWPDRSRSAAVDLGEPDSRVRPSDGSARHYTSAPSPAGDAVRLNFSVGESVVAGRIPP